MGRTGAFVVPAEGSGDESVHPTVRLLLLAAVAVLLWWLWSWKQRGGQGGGPSNGTNSPGSISAREVAFVNDMRRATHVQKLQQQYEDSIRAKVAGGELPKVGWALSEYVLSWYPCVARMHARTLKRKHETCVSCMSRHVVVIIASLSDVVLPCVMRQMV